MNKLIAFLLLIFVSFLCNAEDCNPQAKDVAKLDAISATWFTVNGPLAEFNFCDSSASLDFPFGADKPPLMILVHGGGGRGRDTEMAAYNFRRLGFATLLFDSYRMNNFTQGYQFFSLQVTNEARQRMSLKVTKTAYEWALKSERIKNKKIYLWGVSNGASVAVNLADIADSSFLKAIFAEGLPPNGIGLPEKFDIPIYLAYGELDNYGTRIEANQLQWTRDGFCDENTELVELINRNSLQCNAKINSEKMYESTQSWYDRVKGNGQPIQMKIYSDAAHDFFLNGPLKGTNVKNGKLVGANLGASNSARNHYLEDIKKIKDLN